MNTRILVILDIVINALNMYLASIAKIDLIRALIKKSFKRLVILVILLLVLLVSTWMSILGVVFFYLVTVMHVSSVYAILGVLGINLLSLGVVIVWFGCIKKQIVAQRRSSSKIALAYASRAITKFWNKT